MTPSRFHRLYTTALIDRAEDRLMRLAIARAAATEGIGYRELHQALTDTIADLSP